MTGTVLAIILGLISLATLIFRAVNDKSSVKQKEQDDEDKKIDAADNADDIIRESGRL